MTKKERAKVILDILRDKFKNPKIALNYETEYQLMVAVILSAQCTDKRVNIVTEDFFKIVKEATDMQKLSIEEIETYIKSIGLFKSKAKSLKLNADMLIEKYNGILPHDIEKLMELPGVGRKTANVLLGDLWSIRVGIVVDTHVRRLSNRIGLVDNDNVEIIEKELMKIIKKESWYEYSHFLILQGRDKCIARNPKCSECEINKYCKYKDKNL